MRLSVKICGLKTEETVEAAIEAGADMIGLNFHPKSPRFVSLEAAARLAARARFRARIVALTADAGDAELTAIVSAIAPDLVQFHGRENHERVRDVRANLGVAVMKAVGVAEGADLAAARAIATVADHVLLDAKPPKDATYPGGHGRPFDWTILAKLPPALAFMLSGGLTPENVGEAIRTMRGMGLSLMGIDVSSGVESAPGVKDVAKIGAFVAAVRDTERRTAAGE